LIDKDGNIPNNDRILLVDSIAAAAGGAGSISSNTSYIESASGVGEGARTGLASVVTGICFLLTTFLAPLVAIIPYEAATPALVIVGFLMMTQIKSIDWDDYGIAIPAFLTVILDAIYLQHLSWNWRWICYPCCDPLYPRTTQGCSSVVAFGLGSLHDLLPYLSHQCLGRIRNNI
jgi:hypothetical protein